MNSRTSYGKGMVFVDGTNLLLRSASVLEFTCDAAKPPWWLLKFAADELKYRVLTGHARQPVVRKYWFASYRGDEQYHQEYCEELRSYAFEPMLYRQRGRKEKGVDIGLTMEMLVNAFNQNYDWALLVAGTRTTCSS